MVLPSHRIQLKICVYEYFPTLQFFSQNNYTKFIYSLYKAFQSHYKDN